jgi:hypothetical protein
MSQAIIFTNKNGGVSVCYPTNELPIEEVQAKDTPTGSLIVNVSDLPTDNDFFNAWELDVEALGEPTGIGIDYEDWVKEYKK